MSTNNVQSQTDLERSKLEAEIGKLKAETLHQHLLNRSYWWRAAFAGVVGAVSLVFMFHSFFKISLDAQEAKLELVESETQGLKEEKAKLERERATLAEATLKLRQERDTTTRLLEDERGRLTKALSDADQAARLTSELAATNKKLNAATRQAAQLAGAQPPVELAKTITDLEKRLDELTQDRKRLSVIAAQAQAACSVGLAAITGRAVPPKPSWDEVLTVLFEAYQPYEDFSDDPANASRAFDRLKTKLLPNEKPVARISVNLSLPVVFTNHRILAANGGTQLDMNYDDLTNSAIEAPNDTTIKLQSRSINLAGSGFGAPATRLLLMQLRALRSECATGQGA